MNHTKYRERGLELHVSQGRLIIRIGTEALVNACRYSPVMDELDESAQGELIVEDQDAFAEAIRRALEHEEEDGTTLVHKMLDDAFRYAVEQGFEGFELTQPANL